ncbi:MULTISPECIES: hypothetical protein [unclassified Streptomyces]|uniref:hypothetical protein n=1 Tax=unclassified Streptomyces TaxID=2593676 RepID=UPI00381C79C6
MAVDQEIAEAQSIAGELRNAPARSGITLPSLGLDPISYTNEKLGPLIDLGRRTPDTARRLCSVLPEGKP